MVDFKESKHVIQTEFYKVDEDVNKEENAIEDLELNVEERLGWKNIFLLSFEPVWMYLLLTAAYVNSISSMYIATSSESLLESREVKGKWICK